MAPRASLERTSVDRGSKRFFKCQPPLLRLSSSNWNANQANIFIVFVNCLACVNWKNCNFSNRFDSKSQRHPILPVLFLNWLSAFQVIHFWNFNPPSLKRFTAFLLLFFHLISLQEKNGCRFTRQFFLLFVWRCCSSFLKGNCFHWWKFNFLSHCHGNRLSASEPKVM